MTSIKGAIIGSKVKAFGADPSDTTGYEFTVKVVSLSSLIASHDESLNINEEYPKELQPRLRDRAASKIQIDRIARNLNPSPLLHDSGFLDTGPMIVGSDNVVESGNGRIIAMRKAVEDYPAQYADYKEALIDIAPQYGLDTISVKEIDNPVLVRERITPVDRVKFTADANVSGTMAMSTHEQALQDAGRLSDNVLSQLEVGEDQSIEQALRAKSNYPVVTHFVSSIPANERATISDSKGDLSLAGLQRLKSAIFLKTYPGEAGQRLARVFTESLDPGVKNMENALFQSLPDMAKAESLIGRGLRDKELSVADDFAEAIDTYARLKQEKLTIPDYLAQGAMFEERLTPTQKQVLKHLDDIHKQPKKIREFVRNTAETIIVSADPAQPSFMGIEKITKGVLISGAINEQRREQGQAEIETIRAASSGLEKPAAIGGGVAAQTGLAGLGKESAQSVAFGEFGTAPGQGGKKDTLIDVEKEKAKEAAKPLPGQIEFGEAEAERLEELERRGGYAGVEHHKVKPRKEPKAFITPEEPEATNAVEREREARKDPKIQALIRKGKEELEKADLEIELRKKGVLTGLPNTWGEQLRKLAGGREVTIEFMKGLREKEAAQPKQSVRGQLADKRATHKRIIDPDNKEAMSKWRGQPGIGDVQGVDTRQERGDQVKAISAASGVIAWKINTNRYHVVTGGGTHYVIDGPLPENVDVKKTPKEAYEVLTKGRGVERHVVKDSPVKSGTGSTSRRSPTTKAPSQGSRGKTVAPGVVETGSGRNRRRRVRA